MHILKNHHEQKTQVLIWLQYVFSKYYQEQYVYDKILKYIFRAWQGS